VDVSVRVTLTLEEKLNKVLNETFFEKLFLSRVPVPVIIATCNTEIRRIQVRGQPGEKVHETPPSLN
jgi:hypothetical protein